MKLRVGRKKEHDAPRRLPEVDVWLEQSGDDIVMRANNWTLLRLYPDGSFRLAGSLGAPFDGILQERKP